MTFTVQHIRSPEENRRPSPTDLVSGQLAVNYHNGNPGLFFKTDANTLAKVGPVFIGQAAPVTLNHMKYSVGEQWLDTSGTHNQIKIWDGQEWLSTGISGNSSIIPEDGFDCDLTLGDPDHRWGNIYACDFNLFGDFTPPPN